MNTKRIIIALLIFISAFLSAGSAYGNNYQSAAIGGGFRLGANTDPRNTNGSGSGQQLQVLPQPMPDGSGAPAPIGDYPPPAPKPVYTDGKTRDANGCITGTPEYDKEWGTGRMNTLRNNQGRFMKICPKAAPETPTTPADEEDNGPSEEALIAQRAAHEYTSMSLPTPVLKANDGKEAHPGYLNLYYGYNTHFYTEKTSAGTQRKEATLLGNKIIIEAIPVGYTYIYGDKLPNNTVSYPSGPVSFSERLDDVPLSDSSHVYTVTGNFHAYVQVTYQGRYQTPDGVWHVIDGSVSKRSEPLLMRIWRDDSHPVAKTCLEDPYARGCPSGPGGRSDPDNPNPRLMVPDVFTGQGWHKDDSGVGDTEVQRWRGYQEIPVKNEVWERRHYSQR